MPDPPTFYVLPPLFQVFLGAESVVAAHLFPEVVVLAIEAEVVSVVVESAVVSEVAGFSLEVAVLVAESRVFAPVSVAGPEAAVAGSQASVDIAVAFVVLVPVSVVAVEVDSSGRPRFVASSPNTCSFPSPSSFVELGYKVLVCDPTDARTSYDLCSILSNLGLHHNKNVEHGYNDASPGYNNMSDTNDLPTDATTNHSRKTGLHQCKDQRRHTSQV